MLFTQYFTELSNFPYVKQAFFSFAVSIFCTVETTFGGGHLAPPLGEYFTPYLAKFCLSCRLISLCVGHGQQGLIVKHLIKVGDKPFPIH